MTLIKKESQNTILKFSMATFVALSILVFPLTNVYASDVTVDVSTPGDIVINTTANTLTVGGTSETYAAGDNIVIKGTGTAGIDVTGTGSASITLDGATLTGSDTKPSALSVASGATADVTLKGTNKLIGAAGPVEGDVGAVAVTGAGTVNLLSNGSLDIVGGNGADSSTDSTDGAAGAVGVDVANLNFGNTDKAGSVNLSITGGNGGKATGATSDGGVGGDAISGTTINNAANSVGIVTTKGGTGGTGTGTPGAAGASTITSTATNGISIINGTGVVAANTELMYDLTIPTGATLTNNHKILVPPKITLTNHGTIMNNDKIWIVGEFAGTAPDDSGMPLSYVVTHVTIDPVESTSLPPSASMTLTATLKPAEATSTVSWESSDTNVILVNATTGEITWAAASTTPVTITAKATNDDINAVFSNYTGSTEVHGTMDFIATDALESIAIPATGAVKVNSTITLPVTYTPNANVTKEVDWSSSNDNIATVTRDKDGNGVVKGVSVGTATIKATPLDKSGGAVAVDSVITVSAQDNNNGGGSGGGGGGGSNKKPIDSTDTISKNISSASAKGNPVTVSTGSATALTLSEENVSEIQKGKIDLIVKGENVSITFKSDDIISMFNGSTRITFPLTKPSSNLAGKYDSIDSINSKLLPGTLSNVAVYSGGKIVSVPSTITYDLSSYNLNSDQTSKLVGVMDKNGYKTMKGTYNAANKSFTLPTLVTGTYGVVVSEMAAEEVKTVTLQVGKKSYDVDGKAMTSDVEPMIIDGTTYVPVRFVAESMGATVTWDPDTLIANFALDGMSVNLSINNSNVKVVNDRMLVPVRYIAESFGAKVDWTESTKTIVVTR